MKDQIKETIDKISYFKGYFPKEELQFLLNNRDETVPYLLDAIQMPEVLETLASEELYFLPTYALLILAQYRETRAYPFVYELFSADSDLINASFGDFITEELPRVLASVSGGDVSLINKLVEDEKVYEFVRTAAIDSWLALFRAGLKTREEAVSYFKTLFEETFEEESVFCGALVGACVDLKAKELLPEIEKCYAEDKVDLMLMGDYQEFQDEMAGSSYFLGGMGQTRDLIDDLIGDLEKWFCFKDPEAFLKESEFQPDPDDEFDELPDYDLDESLFRGRGGTYVREFPKVGKNEQCPCGSGRKFKKCCLSLIP